MRGLRWSHYNHRHNLHTLYRRLKYHSALDSISCQTRKMNITSHHWSQHKTGMELSSHRMIRSRRRRPLISAARQNATDWTFRLENPRDNIQASWEGDGAWDGDGLVHDQWNDLGSQQEFHNQEWQDYSEERHWSRTEAQAQYQGRLNHQMQEQEMTEESQEGEEEWSEEETEEETEGEIDWETRGNGWDSEEVSSDEGINQQLQDWHHNHHQERDQEF